MNRSFAFRLFLFLFVGILSLPVFSKKTPKVKFSTEVIDFGELSHEDVYVRKRIFFKNIGKSKLVFVRYSTTCGCTSIVQFPYKGFQPNDTSHIDVEFSPSIFHPGDQINKYITIFTNDPKSPTKIKVTAKIK